MNLHIAETTHPYTTQVRFTKSGNVCKKPNQVNALDIGEIVEMFTSHNWKIQLVKTQSTGIHLAIMCKDCGTEVVAMAQCIERPDPLVELASAAKSDYSK